MKQEETCVGMYVDLFLCKGKSETLFADIYLLLATNSAILVSF